jgi:hypothetical protein
MCKDDAHTKMSWYRGKRGIHKEKIHNWYQCKRLLRIRFDEEQEDRYVEKFDGMGQPREHVERCITQWI